MVELKVSFYHFLKYLILIQPFYIQLITSRIYLQSSQTMKTWHCSCLLYQSIIIEQLDFLILLLILLYQQKQYFQVHESCQTSRKYHQYPFPFSWFGAFLWIMVVNMSQLTSHFATSFLSMVQDCAPISIKPMIDISPYLEEFQRVWIFQQYHFVKNTQHGWLLGSFLDSI